MVEPPRVELVTVKAASDHEMLHNERSRKCTHKYFYEAAPRSRAHARATLKLREGFRSGYSVVNSCLHSKVLYLVEKHVLSTFYSKLGFTRYASYVDIQKYRPNQSSCMLLCISPILIPIPVMGYLQPAIVKLTPKVSPKISVCFFCISFKN